MASSINASTSGAGGVITTADNTGILNLQTASTTAVTIDASQNVGIGTNSLGFANSPLGVYATAPTSGIAATISANSSNGSFVSLVQSGTYSWGIGMPAGSSSLTFVGNKYVGNAGTEYMRIASDGKVAIGTSSTGGWAGDCFFESRASSGWAVSAYNTSASSAGAFLARIDNTSRSLQEFYYSTTYVGKITTNGSTTTYGSASDYRLKDNIVLMTGALDKVAQLRPVTYTWKNSGINDNGFIAHELAEVLPNAVNGTKDAVDENGNPVYQTVDTSFLVATLTAAIQEQQTIINDLKARVTALEAK